MTNIVTKKEKLEVIAKNCKELALMNSLVVQYQDSTKSAVENILKMCRSVKEIDDKRKAKLINDFDVMYFCGKVSIDPKSPTFRKYRKIGAYADQFEKYMDQLPSAYTVLFHITTLEPELFEQLIESEQITPSVSLEQLKQILSPKTVNANSDDANFKVVFNTKKMSEDTKRYLIETLSSLSSLEDIDVFVPEKSIPYFGAGITFAKSSKVGSWTVQSVNKP